MTLLKQVPQGNIGKYNMHVSHNYHMWLLFSKLKLVTSGKCHLQDDGAGSSHCSCLCCDSPWDSKDRTVIRERNKPICHVEMSDKHHNWNVVQCNISMGINYLSGAGTGDKESVKYQIIAAFHWSLNFSSLIFVLALDLGQSPPPGQVSFHSSGKLKWTFMRINP